MPHAAYRTSSIPWIYSPMTIYRDHYIDTEIGHRGELRTTIQNPEGDCWFTDGDPQDEIDSLLEETESLEETLSRESEWRRR